MVNKNPKENSFYDIPFIPGYNNSKNIDTMTISPNATRKGTDENSYIEYYVHNANGHMGMKKVSEAALKL